VEPAIVRCSDVRGGGAHGQDNLLRNDLADPSVSLAAGQAVVSARGNRVLRIHLARPLYHTIVSHGSPEQATPTQQHKYIIVHPGRAGDVAAQRPKVGPAQNRKSGEGTIISAEIVKTVKAKRSHMLARPAEAAGGERCTEFQPKAPSSEPADDVVWLI
ncbi:unnamed protein product, partial [Symbiodinium sp. CCMP2456]